MSAYRNGPENQTPVVIKMKRSTKRIGLTIGLLAFVSLPIFLSSTATRLECSREAGQCQVTVKHGPGMTTFNQRFPIASIERAALDTHTDKEGTTTEALALVIDGKTVFFNNFTNTDHDGKTRWVNMVNNFLQDPKQKTYEVEYGGLLLSYLYTLFALAVLGFVLRMQTTFTINKQAKTLSVTQTRFGSSTKTIPLELLAAVEIEERPDEENRIYGVVARQNDGQSQDMTTFSRFGRDALFDAVRRVNEALSQVG